MQTEQVAMVGEFNGTKFCTVSVDISDILAKMERDRDPDARRPKNPRDFAKAFLDELPYYPGRSPPVLPVKSTIFHDLPYVLTCEIIRFCTKTTEQTFNRVCTPRFWKGDRKVAKWWKRLRKEDYEAYNKRRRRTNVFLGLSLVK